MEKTIYETNYQRLNKILGGLLDTMEFDHVKLQSKGFMDLHVDKLTDDTIAIAHNYSENGDVVADPDMQLRIIRYHGKNYIEAMTFQNRFLYHEVYPEPGMFIPKLKKQLNSFLRQWLTNLKSQGFKYEAQKALVTVEVPQ
jgi:uncharacterized protein YqiB (DUF1249 family)